MCIYLGLWMHMHNLQIATNKSPPKPILIYLSKAGIHTHTHSLILVCYVTYKSTLATKIRGGLQMDIWSPQTDTEINFLLASVHFHHSIYSFIHSFTVKLNSLECKRMIVVVAWHACKNLQSMHLFYFN